MPKLYGMNYFLKKGRGYETTSLLIEGRKRAIDSPKVRMDLILSQLQSNLEQETIYLWIQFHSEKWHCFCTINCSNMLHNY